MDNLLDSTEWLDKYMGYEIEKKCPQCKSKLFADSTGDEWCSCGYSTNEQLATFIKSLKGDRDVD